MLHSSKGYISPAVRRARAQARLGWLIIAACALGFVAMGYAAYSIDQAHGVSVSQSLDSVGL